MQGYINQASILNSNKIFSDTSSQSSMVVMQGEIKEGNNLSFSNNQSFIESSSVPQLILNHQIQSKGV